MKNILIVAMLLVLSSCKNEQKEPIKELSPKEVAQYEELKNKAFHLYQTKEYVASAQKYSEAFKLAGNRSGVLDRYDAACSWALANEIDAAFVQLFIIAEKETYSKYDHITKDTDLTSLHSDKRWTTLLALVRKNKEDKEAHLEKPLVTILDSIYREDQLLRLQLNEIIEKHGSGSDEVRAQWDRIHEKDAINLSKVKKILDTRGWLGENTIGQNGNLTLFLVIQHAPLKAQEKYLPMLREAVKNKNAQASQLALLEDRVAMRNGKKQIYGSQTKIDPKTGKNYFTPIEDPENVDKRRADVGLAPMAVYARMLNISWDIQKHKEMTEKLAAEQ